MHRPLLAMMLVASCLTGCVAFDPIAAWSNRDSADDRTLPIESNQCLSNQPTYSKIDLGILREVIDNDIGIAPLESYVYVTCDLNGYVPPYCYGPRYEGTLVRKEKGRFELENCACTEVDASEDSRPCARKSHIPRLFIEKSAVTLFTILALPSPQLV